MKWFTGGAQVTGYCGSTTTEVLSADMLSSFQSSTRARDVVQVLVVAPAVVERRETLAG